jgi:hypothetical protein
LPLDLQRVRCGIFVSAQHVVRQVRKILAIYRLLWS